MSEALTLQPIGVIRTPFMDRQSAPRQPAASRDNVGTIELFPGRDFTHALADLEAWDHIWVIFWFHLNEGWRPKVLPPRSTTRRGVFATRAPYRPNPIGLSVLRLDRVDAPGLTLHVRDVDMLDGTPLLDIKPYVPYADSVPHASTGWLDPLATDAPPRPTDAPPRPTDAPPRATDAQPDGTDGPTVGAIAPPDPGLAYEVAWATRAAEQAAWVQREEGLALQDRATAVLAMGPQPHPYRRIRRDGDRFCLAVKAWRVHFRIDGGRVRVEQVTTGYRARELSTSSEPQVELHRRFLEYFGGSVA